ncbi:MAG TPA: S8 family serine peptidase, partial [Myxococcales bacterium]|nr:S8 family serine peptidase [Myxococcales bacterium]
MKRILKVFASAAEVDALKVGRVVERYDAFTLLEVEEDQAAAVARQLPVEDISDHYDLHVDGHPVAFDGGDGEKEKLSSKPHHYLVQFIGPIKPDWLKEVKRAGGEPRAPQGAFSYVVRALPRDVEKLQASGHVRFVGHLPFKARLAVQPRRPARGRGAKNELAAAPRSLFLPNTYLVEFFDPEDAKKGKNGLKKAGAKVLHVEGNVAVVECAGGEGAQPSTLEAISRVHGVRWVRERAAKRPSNDVAASLMGAVNTILAGKTSLTGSGETVAVCDTGLDTGDPNTIHPDFKGRIRFIKSYPMTADLNGYVENPGGNDGPADLDSGHGTHVAGSVLGTGAASKELGEGNQVIR